MFLSNQPKKLTLFALLALSLSSCGGGSTDTSSASSGHSGVAQKGPFENNSIIKIARVNSTGVAIGNTIDTDTEGNSGGYKISFPDGWNDSDALQITVEGFYINELDGEKSNNKVKLTSVINNKNLLSINLLTEWEAKRTKVLLKRSENFSEAHEQSEGELIKAFGISNFHELDITRNDKLTSDSSQLLLLSGALIELAAQENINPQRIIDEIGDDFAENGVLDHAGNNWFKDMQEIVRDNPIAYVDKYAKTFKKTREIDTVTGKELPENIVLASRPVANLPKELKAKPGERIVLDGSASHDSGDIINFTWFRIDQQTEFEVPLSNRFSDSPSITVPNVESELLFALIVTDADKNTDTAVIKIIVRNPSNAPVAKNYTCTLKSYAQYSIKLNEFVFTAPDGLTPVISKYIIDDPVLGNTQIALDKVNDDPPLFINDGILTASPSDAYTNPQTIFHYSVEDNSGIKSNIAEVKVIFSP